MLSSDYSTDQVANVMQRHIETTMEVFPIEGSFTISRGAKTTADVVTCVISQAGVTGRGECVPYKRYGESIESVLAEIGRCIAVHPDELDRRNLAERMTPGAARNAVDCALWDLEAKITGISVAERLGLPSLQPLTTAYTISLGEPQVMAAQAAKWSHRDLLKVKVGTEDDESRIRAVREAAPRSRLILDANEAWTDENIRHHLAICARYGVELVEQPLPAGKDALLSEIPHPVTICADESVHHNGDLAALRSRYDAINIKLDKTGGLTEALLMKHQAQELGFRIMVGCMVGTSLAMAPAVLLAQDADYVDLDGPLLLARDRSPGLIYKESAVLPPEPALWG